MLQTCHCWDAWALRQGFVIVCGEAALQVALCFVQAGVLASAYKCTHCGVMLHRCYFAGLGSDAKQCRLGAVVDNVNLTGC